MKQLVWLFLPLLFIACRVQQPTSSERFAQDVQRDMPFKTSELKTLNEHA